MKTYSKYENVLEALRAHVNTKRREGKLLLEGTRELAALLGTSWKTLAKAEAALVEEKILYREKQSTRILPKVHQNGRYAFVTYFHRLSGVEWFEDCRIIWNSFQRQMLQDSLNADYILFDPEFPGETHEKLLEKLKSCTLVFLQVLAEMKDFAELLLRNGIKVVLMNESFSLPGMKQLTQDNYAAGMLAAKKLLDHGYRHPVMIGRCDENYLPNRLRINGFVNTMKKSGVACPSRLYRDFHDRLKAIFELTAWLQNIQEHGFDCVYFPEDLYIELITLPLYEQKLVPDSVGIFAFSNAMSHAARNNPPIASTWEAPEECAARMLAIVRACEQGKYEDVPDKTLFSVQFLPGTSLKQYGKNVESEKPV